MPLPSSYDAKTREAHWQQTWEAEGVHRFRDDLPREQTYVIDTPPPTVSGVLHMGHIFSYTQADFMARYMRMKGMDVFYPMGFDDNGLPTERLVEKVKGVRGNAMSAEPGGREKFIALCREVVKDAEEEFRRLFKSVALSVDWKKEYQTISDEVRALSQASFVDLFQKGLAYRKLQPMLWDPVDQTAIAQAEIEDKELSSSMNDIFFFLDSKETPRETITIATTRPELLAACVAVFYHPEDARYAHLQGKNAITPLFGIKVPILADENVKIDKGTGLVMCCTFGDETDIQWWREHELPTRVMLNKYGKLDFSAFPYADTIQSKEKLEEFFSQLTGLKASAAREKTIELLKQHDVLVKQQPIVHAVKCAERSGAPLEILPTHQWFVRVIDQKDALKKKAGECEWYPEYMRLRIDQWIDGLSWDWCVSRQRYFGVPFPVWYSKRIGEEGKMLVADIDQLPVDPMVDLPKGYTREEVTADLDVMDTWATSSISPQINARSLVPNKLFPADLRPQAHEIIRTWAFYTIVKAHLHENTVPWKNLMISGWCLAADKTKMSKSKGNVVTPVALIEEKGADAVRYWASTSRLGADTAFSEDLLKIGRKLVTKLWNASNFCAQHIEKLEDRPLSALEDVKNNNITETLDLWVLTRLHRTVAAATKSFEAYEYADARAAIEDFFWNDFCDNYLELVKARAYGEESANGNREMGEGEKKSSPFPISHFPFPGQQSALLTLHHCLNTVLRLFAPIVPHVTEDIWRHLFSESSIHARGNWPNANEYPLNEAAEKAGMASVEILNAIRKAKSEAGVSIKFPVISAKVYALTAEAKVIALGSAVEDVKAAGNVAEIGFSKDAAPSFVSSGNFHVAVMLAEHAQNKAVS